MEYKVMANIHPEFEIQLTQTIHMNGQPARCWLSLKEGVEILHTDKLSLLKNANEHEHWKRAVIALGKKLQSLGDE